MGDDLIIEKSLEIKLIHRAWLLNIRVLSSPEAFQSLSDLTGHSIALCLRPKRKITKA